MSQKERDWLHWLKQAESRQITQAKAAERMQVSERWVRKLIARKKREGDRVVIHGLRGGRSNRQLPDRLRKRGLGLVGGGNRGFGPTLDRRISGASAGPGGRQGDGAEMDDQRGAVEAKAGASRASAYLASAA